MYSFSRYDSSDELLVYRGVTNIIAPEKCYCTTNLVSFFEYEDENLYSELVQVVAKSNFDVIGRLMGSLSVWERHGNTPLHLAIIFQRTEVFDFILRLQRNLDSVNRYCQTPLHLAVLVEDQYFVQELIKRGANVNVQDAMFCTPLHAAAVRNSPTIAEYLLNSGAQLNYPNIQGRTPLYHACRSGTTDTVYTLLCYGAWASQPNVYGVLPLEVAMQRSLSEQQGNDAHYHEVLFNHTFGKERVGVNLNLLTVAMEVGTPLFPQIIRQVSDVQCSTHDLRELSNVIATLDSDLVSTFLRRFSNVARALVSAPSSLHNKLLFPGPVDAFVVRFMDFLALLFSIKPSYNFLKVSTTFGSIIKTLVGLYKEKRLPYTLLEEMSIFLYSHGLPCDLVHLVVVHQICGFCSLVKFMLDMDIHVTSEKPKAVLPYLLYDVTLTVEKFVTLVRRPRMEYREALRFFASPMLRRWFLKGDIGRKLKKMSAVPSLLELSRNVTRRHIIYSCNVQHSKDFYRLVQQMPISEVYKKILIYETELYRI